MPSSARLAALLKSDLTPRTWGKTVLAYGVAIVSVVLAAVLTVALNQAMTQNQFVIFVLAVMVSSWYGGIGPGVLATVLSTLLINYYFEIPLFQLDLGARDLPRLGVFLAVAMSINVLNESRARAQAQLRLSQQQLVERQSVLSHVGRLATMNELAAGLAHELNQPLSAIMLYSQGCLELVKSQPQNSEIAQALAATVEQARRASQIVAHYRNFIRRNRTTRGPVALAQVTSTVLLLLGHEIHKHSVHVTVDIPPHLPTVWGDQVQIEQVLLNLVKNSVESLAQQSGQRQLTVRAGPGTDDHVTIEVRDNGQGLPSSDLGRAFDPFYTTKDEGLGLGLSISRSIVESHGGTIALEAAPPRGLIARVRLPAGDAADHP